jgi:hypothetical protein|tara:strand:+ start:1887 stop:2654 length:768 start_codon:yes stop_codon:yes gene_type:complete
MSILDEVQTGMNPGPVKMNVGGTDGIGKTTFAAGAPKPIFIKTEEGTRYVNTSSFPLCESFEDIMHRLKQLVQEEHDFKTVVLDTTDWAEKLIQEEVARQKNVSSIEDIGYGKGYTMTAEGFQKILRALDVLNDQKNMNVILLSHVAIRTFADPEREPYDRWELNLHKKVSSKIREWVDFNLFANHQIRVTKSGSGFNEQTRALAMGDRMLFTKFSPAFDAKSRVPLPDKIELKWDSFIDEYKKSINNLMGAKSA